MELTYQTEILSVALIAEAGELMKMHKAELCLHDDYELDPDWELYFAASAMGKLVICTARVKSSGDLIGYVAYAIHQHLHYRGVKQAVQDVLFLHPSRRGNMAGYRLIHFADVQLERMGVQTVSHHVKVKFDFGAMLERQGYALAEKIYEKRLG